MKQLLITIAAVVLVGCGKTQKSDTKIENELVKTVTKSSQSKLNTSKVLSCCNSIHEAAANGEIDAVKAHLNAGADVNERDSDGLTPLHLVEKKEIAELLIANGAELNPIDNFFKYTPLDFMEGEVGQDTINFLRKHGGKTAEGKQLQLMNHVGHHSPNHRFVKVTDLHIRVVWVVSSQRHLAVNY